MIGEEIMQLSRLGEYIELVDNRNTDLKFNQNDVRGISTSKVFIKTKADLNNVNLSNYKVVNLNEFAYVADTSRRGEKIGLAYVDTEPCIISSIYTTFKVKDDNKLISKYLMMYFNRSEFDRYARFNSWGSARETFSWEDFCDIELVIPPIEIQKKYVAVYESLLHNLKVYESKLEDLKLVCDGYIEELRRNYGSEEIKGYIEEVSNKNLDKRVEKILGISKDGFINPNQKPGDLEKYYIFDYNNFVYSPPRINVGSIGIYKEKEKAVCSPIYVVFKVKNEKELNPDYLMVWLRRSEFLRSTDFYSIASVRNNFSYDIMSQTKICIPSIDIQDNIVKVFNTMNKRKEYVAKLKKKIQNICPILIKGSIEECR